MRREQPINANRLLTVQLLAGEPPAAIGVNKRDGLWVAHVEVRGTTIEAEAERPQDAIEILVHKLLKGERGATEDTA